MDKVLPLKQPHPMESLTVLEMTDRELYQARLLRVTWLNSFVLDIV